MSIFPKRTIPGKGVTIHWNFNTSHLRDVHIFPFVRIGVKAPDGTETMLFEDHLLALPDPTINYDPERGEHATGLKYLNKNTPLLIIADYLSGAAKREVLVNILQAIQSGRHFYFHFPVEADAPPGKYTLISEVHNGGEVRYSKTASDDFFFVEKLEVKNIVDKKSRIVATIQNLSPEPTPVKINECYVVEGKIKSNVRVFEVAPAQETLITCLSRKSFLLYNEEREVIPLYPDRSEFVLRNQQLLTLRKIEENKESVFVINKQNDNVFTLEGAAKEIWENADGMTSRNELRKNAEAYAELLRQGLIQEVDLLNHFSDKSTI